MRILGIETSSPRGSVALIEDGQIVAARCHQAPTTRAEETLDFVGQLLNDASWERSSLGLVAVGIGPGSFTGLRVGIAIGQGIAIGLGLPIVGVNSLRAMAAGTPDTDMRIRCPLLDARRDEVFVAAYGQDGNEIVAPQAIGKSAVPDFLAQHIAEPFVALGSVARELLPEGTWLESEYTDLPHAACVAREANRLRTADASVAPLYIRDVDAKLPDLPVSPLELPRTR